MVVAKYIENPLLVSGYKCDLRLYVLVTCYDPLIVYLYEEGLVRLATVKYDPNRKHLWNPCMHLCNYSINKHHSDYIKVLYLLIQPGQCLNSQGTPFKNKFWLLNRKG